MSHLLSISVGPVQEFIAAARRTRDLWFGSYLLSEISRAVANSVEGQGGKLIFPARSDAKNVANVILAEVPGGDPKPMAAKAKQAAQLCWRQFADEARREASGVIHADVWNDQVDDVIEFYAAWVSETGNYPQNRSDGIRLLSGRKNCRDFRPALGRAGLPKSSLDGQRETVLRPPEEWPQRFRARLRIREGEQLDAVGLVKRVAEGNRPYPSVSRIAADPWVRGNLQRLGEVIAACDELEAAKVLRRLDTKAYPQFDPFPYEGTAIYPSRHHELLEETVESDEERSHERLYELREALARLPEPDPYLAVLVADGDKMGAAISKLNTADENRRFSETLAGFAEEAQEIISVHHGVLVYAGGDDVLAFLPVDLCLACTRTLHDAFGKRMGSYGETTLSAGIAIGHFMENLEDLLRYGRAAEKAAKQPDRDGLAVHLHKRGGTPIEIRCSWKDDPAQRLTNYAELIQAQAIPGKLPYELRRLAGVYKDWQGNSAAEALRQDVLRVIRDKQPRAGRAHLDKIEALVSERLKDSVSLQRFAEELLVARQIATARTQAKERPVVAEEVK